MDNHAVLKGPVSLWLFDSISFVLLFFLLILPLFLSHLLFHLLPYRQLVVFSHLAFTISSPILPVSLSFRASPSLSSSSRVLQSHTQADLLSPDPESFLQVTCRSQSRFFLPRPVVLLSSPTLQASTWTREFKLFLIFVYICVHVCLLLLFLFYFFSFSNYCL